MQVESLLMLGLSIALFVVKVFALIDCIGRKPAAFVAAETLAKQGWLVILGIAIAAHVVRWSPLSFLNLAGTVAALVYLAQMRGSADSRLD